MRPDQASSSLPPSGATGCLVLSDGSVFWGKGFGALSDHVGEVCFNTSMTGYQEILTDPSYAGQIITFTFPHIGNVGCNLEDIETMNPVVRGLIIRADVTEPSNWRAVQHLDAWLKARGIVGLSGIDTRALTQRIRDLGAPNGAIVHRKANFDIAYLHKKAKEWPGLSGMDLAKEVSCRQSYSWNETVWTLESGYGRQEAPRFHVVAVDYGAKRNILRMLASSGCKVTVVPATATIDDIMHHHPDGVFLSNGPGDPAATGQYAVPVIKELLNRRIPLFGICLGHQLMGLALGGRTEKMPKGHRGANHPVKDLETGKVEITSQNHGFCVIPSSLPDNAKITHTSLFDNSCEGIRVTDRPAFCVQYHPEASPGPHDSHYLFSRFIALMEEEQINLQKSTKQVRIA